MAFVSIRVSGCTGSNLFFCTLFINLLHRSGNPVCLPGYVALECFCNLNLGLACPGWYFGEHRILLFCLTVFPHCSVWNALWIEGSLCRPHHAYSPWVSSDPGQRQNEKDHGWKHWKRWEIHRSPAPGLCGLAGRAACSGHHSSWNWLAVWCGLSGRYCSGLYRAVCGFQRRGKGKNAPFPDLPGKHEQRLRGICARYVGDQSI